MPKRFSPILVFALASLAGAAGQGDPSKDPWVTGTLVRLKHGGTLPMDFGSHSAIGSATRPPSRYEIAVAAHAGTLWLLEATEDATVEAEEPAFVEGDDLRARHAVARARAAVRKLRAFGAHVQDLRRLARLFGKELTDLGVDVPAMDGQLTSASVRIARTRVPALGSAWRPLQAFPKDHWVRVAIDRLQADGILVRYSSCTVGFGEAPSRYELAVAAHAAWSALDPLIGPLEKDMQLLVRTDPTPPDAWRHRHRMQDLRTQAKRHHTHLRDLRRLAHYFRKELTDLGVDVPDTQHRLAAASGRLARMRVAEAGAAFRAFSDVPKTHWASEATRTLRREGILRGYPDGRYRG